ncbi:MAG: sensor domain-containing diguanylate cyclase [Pseudomonadota bacterium]
MFERPIEPGVISLNNAAAERKFNYITEFAAEFTNVPIAIVSVVQSDDNNQLATCASNLPELRQSRRDMLLSHAFCKQVRETGSPCSVADARTDQRFCNEPDVGELGIVSYLGVPIHGFNGESIGALCVMDTTPREWAEFEIEKLKKLASFVDDQIRLLGALHLSEQQKVILARLATTDSLTGAYNRRALFERMDQERARQKRHPYPISLIVFDIDHFKVTNDTHGHAGGDVVLVETTQRIVARIRENLDFLARVGGEEFAVLLPDTDAEAAIAAAERFRVAIASEPFDIGANAKEAITASFGIATVRSADFSSEVLIGQADAALYAAKRSGRNRVELYDLSLSA